MIGVQGADLRCVTSRVFVHHMILHGNFWVQALETKIAASANFKFIELADTLRIRTALDGPNGISMPGNSSSRPQRRQQRSRSPVCGRRSRSPRRGRGSRGHRDNSCVRRGGRACDRDNRHRGRSPKIKHDIWEAVVEGDEVAVQCLIDKGNDIEEKYDGW